MKTTPPSHLRRQRWALALFGSAVFASPAFALSDDAKLVLQLLVTKGVITQKDYDDTLNAIESKPADGVPPVQFVQDALGVTAKDVQKATEYAKKDEKNGAVKPSGNGTVSADGNSSFNFTGLVHFDARSIADGLAQSADKDAASGADNFEVRRARIGINGTLYKDISYEVLTNVVGSNANLVQRAYVNYGFNPAAQVRVGRFKQPFSLEQLTSSNAIDFMERSYGDQLVPAHRNGAGVFGEPTKGFTYAFSFYQDGFNEISNTNNIGNSNVGRLSFNAADFAKINNTVIHFGAAKDQGRYQVLPTTSTDSGAAANTSTRATILSFRSENRGLANAYRAQIGGDTVTAAYGAAANNAANVNKDLKGLEFALATGGLKFQAETIKAAYSASAANYNTAGANLGTAKLDVSADTSYYEFIYNLTGESWSEAYKAGAFGAIKPKANFGLGSGGGSGAWQLAARVSTYETSLAGTTANAAITDGGSNKSRAENSEKASTITYGLNWIVNPNSRVLLNYARTTFDRPVTYLSTSNSLGTTTKEDVVSVRSQINF